jgi:phospholipase/carboxylesterase
MTAASTDPHRDQPVRHFGEPLNRAKGVVILLHGRGGSAEDILSLAQPLYHPGVAYLAPQAAGHTWYPNSFMAPIEANQPWLDSALRKVDTIVEETIATGIASDRILLGGFSQGACLSTEYVASHPRRYAGLIALTGGLIGPPGADLSHTGSLAGTPAFLGSGDPDPHVPFERVQQSAQVLTAMGASVTLRHYPGRPHTITPEELDFARRLLKDAFSGSSNAVDR